VKYKLCHFVGHEKKKEFIASENQPLDCKMRVLHPGRTHKRKKKGRKKKEVRLFSKSGEGVNKKELRNKEKPMKEYPNGFRKGKER